MSNDESDRFATQAFDLEAIMDEFSRQTPAEKPSNLDDTIHWVGSVAELPDWGKDGDLEITRVRKPGADTTLPDWGTDGDPEITRIRKPGDNAALPNWGTDGDLEITRIRKSGDLSDLPDWGTEGNPEKTIIRGSKAKPTEEPEPVPPEQPPTDAAKRYLDLQQQRSEQTAITMYLSILMAVISALGVFLSSAGVVRNSRAVMLIGMQLVPLMCSAILGSRQMLAGLKAMRTGRLTPESLLIFSLIASLLDWALSIRQLRLPCCAVFSLQVTMSLWANHHRRSAQLRELDTLRKASALESILRSEGYYERKAGFLRGQGQSEDFLSHQQETAAPDKAISWYLLAVLLFSLAAAVTVGIRLEPGLGVQSLSAFLLVGFPATGFIVTSLPKAIASSRLHKVGSVVCGWSGVEELCKDGAVPLSDQHLFPDGSVKLNGVKFYTDRDPDQIVAYANALIGQEGGLAPLFRQLAENRGCPQLPIKNQRTYTNGGMSGEVNGEPVLVGTLRFMQSMGVELPEGTRVNQAVYLAVNGIMCAVFAINYTRDRHVLSGLNALCGYSNLRPVLLTGDFMLTAGFLRRKFGTHATRMLCPTPAVRQALATRTAEENAPVCALLTSDSLESIAYTITGARSLRTAMKYGVFFQIISGIMGLAAVSMLLISGGSTAAHAGNVLLFQLIQAIPALILAQWARAF